jgi:chromosome segregation ATPase
LDAKQTELDDLRNQQERENYPWKKRVDEKDADLLRVEKQLQRTLQNLPSETQTAQPAPTTHTEIEELKQENATLQQELSEVQGYWDDTVNQLERVRADDSTDKNSKVTEDNEALRVELTSLHGALDIYRERDRDARNRAGDTYTDRSSKPSKTLCLRRVCGVSSDGSPMKYTNSKAPHLPHRDSVTVHPTLAFVTL